jgi:hypothetical protein
VSEQAGVTELLCDVTLEEGTVVVVREPSLACTPSSRPVGPSGSDADAPPHGLHGATLESSAGPLDDEVHHLS